MVTGDEHQSVIVAFEMIVENAPGERLRQLIAGDGVTETRANTVRRED